MVDGRDFLEIQIRFAERAAAITGTPLEGALFTWTSLPVRFGVPFSDLVETHPRWQRFLDLLHQQGGDRLAGVAEAYQQHVFHELEGMPSRRPQFGCFAYGYGAERRVIRPHFGNRDDPE